MKRRFEEKGIPTDEYMNRCAPDDRLETAGSYPVERLRARETIRA